MRRTQSRAEAEEPRTFAPPGKTPKDDTASVMKFYGISARFPREVLEEAARCGMDAPGRRLDLRRKFIFTCDPETARDYDDALSLWKGPGGRRVLGVHIADVSHFVPEGGVIDREACKRSTSVYFADRVVPMLPEALSNGLCSLVPGEDRLAFSVFIEFDADGNAVKRSFAKSVIRSKARYAYADVMDAIAGRASAVKGAARKTVLAVHGLAQQLRKARFAAGALDIDIPDAEAVIDAAGEMARIVVHPYDESHQMIEECMVAANEAVAAELASRGAAILSRLHEAPDPERLAMLRLELRAFGIKTGELDKPRVFKRFLETAKRHPLYQTLATMILRSMKRAVYDSSKCGHFGLAKRHYAHFTSPIRRYPDLTLHRQLAALLDGKSAKVPQAKLDRLAKHCTEMEQRAADAERDLLEIKKYRVLQAQLEAGMRPEYDATIVKCAPFGCFAEIPELAVSGLVHVSMLSRGWVRFNKSDQTLSGGGGSWRIGQKLRVKVLRIDFDQRRIELAPVRERKGRGRA